MRKLTEQDVREAYANAQKAKESAQFSARRARQLRDGADRMREALKRQKKKAKPPKGTQSGHASNKSHRGF